MSRNRRKRKAAWRKEFIPMGWRLIEWRLAYYYPELVHEKLRPMYVVPDWMFDQYEQRYLTLCYLLGEINYNAHKIPERFRTTVHHAESIELDFERPSVQLVCNKLSGREHPMTKTGKEFGGDLISSGKNGQATGGGASNIIEEVGTNETRITKTAHVTFIVTGDDVDDVNYFDWFNQPGWTIDRGDVKVYYTEKKDDDSASNKAK